MSDPSLRAAARGALPRRGELHDTRRHLLLRIDRHRAARRGALRHRNDGAAAPERAIRGPSTVTSQRPDRPTGTSCWRRSPGRAATAADLRRPNARCSTHAARHMGRTVDVEGARGSPRRRARTPAVGRRGTSLPELRELHDGVPDVLLQHGRGPLQPRRHRHRAPAPLGLVLHGGVLLHPRRQHAPERARPLSPVGHAQVPALGRSVRHIGLRGLRPVHHVVPGRHRHHAGAEGGPWSEARSLAARAMPAGVALTSVAQRSNRHGEGIAGGGFSRDSRSCRGSRPSTWTSSSDARRTCGSSPASSSSARATRRTTSTWCAAGRVSVEVIAPQRGAITIETVGEGDLLGWSWLIPPFQWHFDARALNLTRAIALDARCLRGEVRRRPRARLRAAEAVLAGHGAAPRGDAPAAARPVRQRVRNERQMTSRRPIPCGRTSTRSGRCARRPTTRSRWSWRRPTAARSRRSAPASSTWCTCRGSARSRSRSAATRRRRRGCSTRRARSAG